MLNNISLSCDNVLKKRDCNWLSKTRDIKGNIMQTLERWAS